MKAENDFTKDIPEYSDERIVEILKQRDHYQPEAAKLAVDEAIKRGIIFSEQDLFSEDYKSKELGFSVFPPIKKEESRNKIRQSIARSLMICGVLSVAFGILQIYNGSSVEGGLIFVFGLVWVYCAAQLIKNYQKIFVYGILVEAIITMVYVVAKLVLMQRFVVFDYFVPGALFLLVVYGLFFLKRVGEQK